ncbi:hypothetical protein GCM10027297_36770 [Parahaliea aestuarii]
MSGVTKSGWKVSKELVAIQPLGRGRARPSPLCASSQTRPWGEFVEPEGPNQVLTQPHKCKRAALLGGGPFAFMAESEGYQPCKPKSIYTQAAPLRYTHCVYISVT